MANKSCGHGIFLYIAGTAIRWKMKKWLSILSELRVVAWVNEYQKKKLLSLAADAKITSAWRHPLTGLRSGKSA